MTAKCSPHWLQIALLGSLGCKPYPRLFDGLEDVVSLEAVADMAGGDKVPGSVIRVVGIWHLVVPVEFELERNTISQHTAAQRVFAIEASVILFGQLSKALLLRWQSPFPPRFTYAFKPLRACEVLLPATCQFIPNDKRPTGAITTVTPLNSGIAINRYLRIPSSPHSNAL